MPGYNAAHKQSLYVNKIVWIDIMKGIGILTVVAGHIYEGITVKIIFLFHMPLFFFISGYLFRTRINFKKYFHDKIIHLIIPYTFFLIILYFLFYSIHLTTLPLKEMISHLIKTALGGIFLQGPLIAFWFITCLFIVQQLMNVILVKLNFKRTLILMSIILCLSYINSILVPNFWLPLSANVALAALPIFYLGYLFKKKKISPNLAILILLGLIVILTTIFFEENTYDMKRAYYGIPFITIASSIVLILNIKYLSNKISKSKLISKPFIELGKASMVIMFMHQPINIIISNYLLTNATMRFVISTLCSYILYLFFCKFIITRAFLLGSKKDYEIIKSHLRTKK